ncbi:hypothetical protein [Paractinoplanes brasiliensis]|nr:hypothetical protein [Actinoplanes brasiliensis]GID26220.1 hypothetical protein Abr02nite_12030 [Actinoplanes brasiliensis]
MRSPTHIEAWAEAARAARQPADDDDPQLAQPGREDVRSWEAIVNELGTG